MVFLPDHKPPSSEPRQALWFVYQEQKLIIKVKDKTFSIPRSPDLQQLSHAPIRNQYLGALDGQACYAAELPPDVRVPEGWTVRGLRELFGLLEDEIFWLAGRANQLVDWNKSHQFCGRCGNHTENKNDERAKICHQCGLINYPRVSPAIIVAVHKKNHILLAQNKRLRTGNYSVLAGFVEPGETLEDCVKREVFEETSIKVKNIRYFGSQPWPFPNSLMVAFTAEYAGGEVNANEAEIGDVGWFSADNLPSIPPPISIARWLIDWFKNNY